MKESIISIIIAIAIIVMLVFVIIKSDNSFNSETHSNDITVTEWVSPDGVHYWYQMSGYHAMLAPRYDSNGELVIE